MEFRHLRYFVTVAQTLNFRRAAEQLQMTQQPLSRQIRDLERELDVQLFYRTRREVQLTEAGRAFLDEARQLLASAERAIQVARQVARGQRGRLVIGFCGLATYSVLPRILTAFKASFPNVELELYEMTTSEQVQAVQERKIQLGIVITPVPNGNLSVEPLLREPFVVVLPENHPLATLPRTTLCALAQERFILVPRSSEPGYYDQCISLFERANFTPTVSQEASHKQTILSLVAAGLGVSLATASIENVEWRGVVYSPLEPPVLEVELAALWRPNDSSPVLQSFLAVTRETLSQPEP